MKIRKLMTMLLVFALAFSLAGCWWQDEDMVIIQYGTGVDPNHLDDYGYDDVDVDDDDNNDDRDNSKGTSLWDKITGGELTGNKNNGKKEPNVNIVPTEASQVKMVDYDDPSGYFSLRAPEGWCVKGGDLRETDLISYPILVYDPNNIDRMMYFCLNTGGILKSDEAWDFMYKTYGEASPNVKYPVVHEATTEGWFTDMASFYGYSNFNVEDNLGQTALMGDCLRATYKSQTGKTCSGLFHTAVVEDLIYPYYPNIFDPTYVIDLGWYTGYSIVMLTAPEEEFLEWEPILSEILSSIKYTQTFNKQRKELWEAVMGNVAYVAATADATSDMIMDSWEKRNSTYDIASEKYSDATLGYERVIDVETGERYRAYNGFMDDYDGTRYVPAGDSDYAYAVDGYIER